MFRAGWLIVERKHQRKTKMAQPILRYATARRAYVCTHCHKRIQRGTVYARLDRTLLKYHRACAPKRPNYQDRATEKNENTE